MLRLELLSGNGREWKTPPGREFVISADVTLAELAEQIERMLGRWDRSHLYEFRFADGRRFAIDEVDGEGRGPALVVSLGEAISGEAGERFEYEFDFGDCWRHRLTVLEVDDVDDPRDELETADFGPWVPKDGEAIVVWGWGALPDQYGRVGRGR